MLRRVDAFKQDHARLRELLSQCEVAPPDALRDMLARLDAVFAPHLKAKETLYEMAVLATRSAGDLTGLSLLTIFRANLNVTSSAVLGFLRTPDPQPERLQQRLRSVTSALRSLLETEEKVIFPLCIKHAKVLGTSGSSTWPYPELRSSMGRTK
jgi:hypothetical protein